MSERSPAVIRAGERKLVTILFADLSGYTALAERLDPEEVYSFLRPGMLELQGIVESFGGSAPQIQGDGLMAVFGVPVAHEDDAERAVRAALACRDHVRSLNVGRSGLQFPEVHAGVNSGEVMVAPDATDGFAVVGDTVNTASRLGDLAEAGQVLVDQTTKERTAAGIRYASQRRRRVKGKAEPLASYEALGISPPVVPATPARGFVDRTDVLARLGREFALTEQEGRSRALVVAGEPGIGKTRLAQEFGSSFAPDRFFIGRCSPFGDQGRLWPLAQVVGGAIGIAPGGTGARASLDRVARRIGRAHGASVAPELRTLLGAGDPTDAARSDRDVVRAARLVLEDAARAGTVIVVIDDLQWADGSVQAFVADASRAPWDAPVLVLGLSREPIELIPTTELPGLELAAMRTLAEQLLGEAASADAVGGPLVRANGNALFLEEMVGMLVERGAVRRTAAGWELLDPSAVEQVPDSVRLVIAARIDALPPEEKQMLGDASVCGSTTWRALLDELSAVPQPGRVLRSLVDRGLLDRRPRSSVPGTTEYGWKHALIRDVAYGAMPRAIRAERHLVIAGWLRSTAAKGREPVGAIAHHYERAWELERRRTGPGPSADVAALAAEYLTRAAEQVFAQQARAAEPIFRRALRVLDASGRGADPSVAARAHVGLAEVLIEMGDHEGAIEQAGRARRAAARAGDARLQARTLLVLGRSESDAGRLTRARRLLEDARVRFEREGDLRGQGWALHRLSETWGWQSYDRELEDLDAAYRAFSRARDRFGRAVVANDLAYILSVQGGRPFHRWFGVASRLAEEEGDLRSRALLLRTWGSYAYSAGRYEEAARVMTECRPLAADAGDRYAESDALVVGAIAMASAGDVDGAVTLANEALTIGRALGSVRIPAMGRLALARAATRRGDLHEASRALSAAAASIRARGLRVMAADLAETRAMALLDRGAWGRVDAATDELADTLDQIPSALWEPLPALIAGRAALGLGDPVSAEEALQEAYRIARRVGADGTAALAAAAWTQARVLAGRSAPSTAAGVASGEADAIGAETAGIAALLRGDAHAATVAFDLAVDRWRALGVTAWLARAHAMRAHALRGTGDRARAAASLGRARAVATQLSMPARVRAAIERPPGD